jgi:hypothetical protein
MRTTELGPGQYKFDNGTISSYVNKSKSKLSTTGKLAQMGSSERIAAFKVTSKTPGPGSYVPSSAFGHYVSRNSTLGRLVLAQSKNAGAS